MTVEEFAALMKQEVDAFAKAWIEFHAQYPLLYPLEMDSADEWMDALEAAMVVVENQPTE